MRLLLTVILILHLLSVRPAGAQVIRYVYHDENKDQLKEMYHVRDSTSNVLEGKYLSYYINGNMESEGQFTDNETFGVWKFYYETGKLKMTGDIKQNSNDGYWEYYYESGIKSMEGEITDRKRTGEWKIYFESGPLKERGYFTDDKKIGKWEEYFESGNVKSEIDHNDSTYTEYYPSGEVKIKGFKSGTKPVGNRVYFYKNGEKQAEGTYENGKRTGDWNFYYENGQVSATGSYVSGKAEGEWAYYDTNGKVSSQGAFTEGKKSGYWGFFYKDGSRKGEGVFDAGSGEYKEYYKSGKLRLKGALTDDKNEGTWKYYYENGKLEGECVFKHGRGEYSGYYPNGRLQTRGIIENNQKVGRWELYKKDGTLSGYHKSIYDDSAPDSPDSDGQQDVVTGVDTGIEKKKSYGTEGRTLNKKRTGYFTPRKNEFHGLILSANPFATFIGKIPFGLEFYVQERIGHEFEFEGIRSPFFESDFNIPIGDIFTRGYSISLRQKFYNSMGGKVSLWYFGHELRFVNESHFSNIRPDNFPDNVIRANASEENLQYMVLLGYRLMQGTGSGGFTLNLFTGGGIGFMGFDNDPNFPRVFDGKDSSSVYFAYNFGINIGYVFQLTNGR